MEVDVTDTGRNILTDGEPEALYHCEGRIDGRLGYRAVRSAPDRRAPWRDDTD